MSDIFAVRRHQTNGRMPGIVLELNLNSGWFVFWVHFHFSSISIKLWTEGYIDKSENNIFSPCLIRSYPVFLELLVTCRHFLWWYLYRLISIKFRVVLSQINNHICMRPTIVYSFHQMQHTSFPNTILSHICAFLYIIPCRFSFFLHWTTVATNYSFSLLIKLAETVVQFIPRNRNPLGMIRHPRWRVDQTCASLDPCTLTQCPACSDLPASARGCSNSSGLARINHEFAKQQCKKG